MDGLEPDERAYYASSVFKVALLDDVALQRGAHLRDDMWAEVKAGRTPEGYRWQWLQRASSKVTKMIKDMVLEFNAVHGGEDKASVEDAVDALKLASKRMRSGG